MYAAPSVSATPSDNPPMIAPGMLPNPPMMLAANAFSATTCPIPTLTNSTGATSTPAIPPSAAL
jgi:hypothetical protein